jgi:hypothetical protein
MIHYGVVLSPAGGRMSFEYLRDPEHGPQWQGLLPGAPAPYFLRAGEGEHAKTGVSTPSISRSAQPKRECHQAMSSVCTMADPATASRSRAARVVLPLALRPSTASTTGR